MADPTPDPRDEVMSGANALAGLRDLVVDAARSGHPHGQFVNTRPEELGELLDMVSRRISAAAERLQEFRPPGWPFDNH
jgi:hypothetical protein